MDVRVLNRWGAAAGLFGVVGNVVAVAVLGDIPSAYRPDVVATWADEVVRAPLAASVSGVGFTLGLVGIAGWALVMGIRLGTAAGWVGAFLIAAGALLNAAGTPAPLVVVHLLQPACGETDACRAAAMALLGASLALDATFNLLLGSGLVLVGRALLARRDPRWLGGLVIAAGVASVPVSTQIVSAAGADLLAVAGPLWLLSIVLTSVRMWRGDA